MKITADDLRWRLKRMGKTVGMPWAERTQLEMELGILTGVQWWLQGGKNVRTLVDKRIAELQNIFDEIEEKEEPNENNSR